MLDVSGARGERLRCLSGLWMGIGGSTHVCPVDGGPGPLLGFRPRVSTDDPLVPLSAAQFLDQVSEPVTMEGNAVGEAIAGLTQDAEPATLGGR